MKKVVIIALCALLLCGCSTAETFETVGDEYVQSAIQQQKTVSLTVEEGAVAIHGDTGTIYLCDGYEMTVEICAAGNLSATFEMLTGFGTGDLTVIETSASELTRYECVWASAGEGGDQVGRTVVLDDGVYHYCITFTASAEDAAALQLTWQQILNSVNIV